MQCVLEFSLVFLQLCGTRICLDRTCLHQQPLQEYEVIYCEKEMRIFI